MYRGRETGQTLEDRMGGGVEKLVRDTIDATGFDRAQGLPSALLDDAIQGDAITGAAPGKDQNVWVTGCNGLCGCGFAGVSDEFAACGFD